MDYQKIYDNLMKKRLENPPTEKFERHHIVPRSLGGSNNNIVKLTYREHYIAHLLLCRIHRGTRNYFPMLRALNMMRMGREGDFIKSSRMFEYFREDFARMMSESQSGEGNSQYGTSWYYHPELRMNKKFKVGDIIPEGFIKGRVLKDRPSLKTLNETRTCGRCEEKFICATSSRSKYCESCRFKSEYKIDYNAAYYEWLSSGLTVTNFAKLVNVSNASLYNNWNRLNVPFRDEANNRYLRDIGSRKYKPY